MSAICAGLSDAHEDPAMRLPDQQALLDQRGEGLAEGVAGNLRGPVSEVSESRVPGASSPLIIALRSCSTARAADPGFSTVVTTPVNQSGPRAGQAGARTNRTRAPGRGWAARSADSGVSTAMTG